MNIFKKTLCFLLVISVLLSCLMTVSASEKPLVSEGEIFKKLEALGIIESDYNAFVDEYVTRAELIKYALRMCGFYGDYFAQTTENPFVDVTPSTDGYEEILTAYAMGLVNGTTENTFEPNRYAVSSEAAKLFVTILGYGEVAKNTADVSLGYTVCAGNIGIFNGVKIEKNGKFTAEGLLKLLYNVLHSKVLQISTFLKSANDNELRYETKGEQTLFMLVFGMEQASGIIMSNEYTSVYGDSEVGKNQILTDTGEVYDVGETNAADLLGYFVEFYYKTDDQNCNILQFVSVSEKKNKISVVDSSDIESVSKTEFSYFDQETSQIIKLNFSKTVTLIYNGGQIAFSEQYLRPSSGDVTMIDNNNDGLVDIIHVMSYRTIWVSGVSAGSYTVSDHFGGDSIKLDPAAHDYVLHMEKYGAEIEFDRIAEKDVLSYAESLTGTKKQKFVRLCSKKAEGTVTEIDDHNVIVDNMEYRVTDNALMCFSLRESGIFYLDYTGRIVACDTGYEMVYGWLYAMDMPSLDVPSAKIFTENSRWVTLKLNDKIRFSNGMDDKTITAVDFYNKYWLNAGAERQLIRYNVNAGGKISTIFLALQTEPWSEEEREAIEKKRFRLSRTLATAQYRSPRYRFINNIATLTADAKIFMIPPDTESLEDYFVGQPSNLAQNRVYNNVSIYDANEVGVTGVCVLEKYVPIIAQNAMPMIIESINEGILNDEDGTNTYIINGMFEGGRVSIPVKNKELVNKIGITKGDIITFVLENGKMLDISLVYDNANGENQRFLLNSLSSSGAMLAGRIVSISTTDNMLIVDYGGQEYGLLSIYTLGDIYFYDGDSERDIISRAGISDLFPGESVFIKSSGYGVQEIVIFK